MPPVDRKSIFESLRSAGNLSRPFISRVNATVALGDLLHGSSLSGGPEQLRGKSVLIATREQSAAALALIELDGVARRLILYPPDLAIQHVRFVADSLGVDAIVSEPLTSRELPPIAPYLTCHLDIEPGEYDRSAYYATEWILFTSGTTGQPKMVRHTLSSLAGAVHGGAPESEDLVWSTFYDLRRYGGLQIFLRAVLACQSLVLRSTDESVADFLVRAGALGITHISGTPSHWRRALMCPSARNLAPQYVRLSGEIVDQAILDNLRSFYPHAKIVHAFASTEAGLAFDVQDGLAGFPASFVEQPHNGVQMKVEDGSLRIRSERASAGYAGAPTENLAAGDGFVDTGDLLERRGDRYYFVGRRDGTIKVGGWKVHPEEVEAVINRHPAVQMSLVRGRKSPLTGALIVADVVPKTGQDENGRPQASGNLEDEILQLCRKTLAQYKVPVAIHFVSNLQIAETGKLVREPCGMSS